MYNNDDSLFLQEALKLAKKGIGWTNPNPMVGAIIVKDKRIIGKGYHKKAGSNHGEIEALRSVTENPKGATLYTNLEPCSHFGKTPPCTESLISAGIATVICCTKDPNPKVAGMGIKKLQQAGIKVITGLLENETQVLNETFFTFYEKGRPFIAIKFAASIDGKIATHTYDSRWITNEKARRFARLLRSEYQAVLVGIHTVISDNPHLGTRIKGKKDPIRIILDSSLKIPLGSQVLQDTNVIIATTFQADKEKRKILEKKGIDIIACEGTRVSLPALLQELKAREIISILVEGGSEVHGSFIDAKLADKVYAIHAPLLIGGKKSISAIGGTGAGTIADAIQLHHVSFKKISGNILTIGYITL